jgi:hypothetical protein
LAQEAGAVESTDRSLAIQLYKRASVVYRISRFPYIGTPLKREAFEAQKKAYLKGTVLWDVPLQEVVIPHTHAGEGDDKAIPLYVRMPIDASPEKPCPVMLLITGLDGHRPDNTEVGNICGFTRPFEPKKLTTYRELTSTLSAAGPP